MKKAIPLSLLMICWFCGLRAQQADYLYVTSVRTQNVHSLVLPQTMKISHANKTERILVTGVVPGGLVTAKGKIRFSDIDRLHATRHKPAGRRILGAGTFLLGALSMSLGVVAMSNDWSPGTGVYFLLTGVAISGGGISLMAARRSYTTDSWQFRQLPADAGMRQVTQLPEIR